MYKKILKWVKAYKSWYGDNIKVVMKQSIFDDLQKELEEQGIDNPEEAFDCDVEVYDKIDTDFYVTQKIDYSKK